jgi:hypothetical protein
MINFLEHSPAENVYSVSEERYSLIQLCKERKKNKHNCCQILKKLKEKLIFVKSVAKIAEEPINNIKGMQ